MKFALSLSTIAIICLTVWIIFAQECRRSPDPSPVPAGYVLISQEAVDSINMLANLPSDTVYIDTIKERTVIKWLDREIPEPVILDNNIHFYTDEITSDSVSLWMELWINGTLDQWNMGADIIKTTIDRTIEIPRPVIVTNNIEIPVYERGLYIGLTTGGSPMGGLMFGLEATYLNRKNNYYGVGMSRFGQYNLYEFKLGTRILHW